MWSGVMSGGDVQLVAMCSFRRKNLDRIITNGSEKNWTIVKWIFSSRDHS